jgi:predicted RNase H-like HicB family nuclease
MELPRAPRAGVMVLPSLFAACSSLKKRDRACCPMPHMCYPSSMPTYPEYVKAAMRHATYEQMEDGHWYAAIPGFDGLWATGASIEEARKELRDTLDGWIEVNEKISQLPLPIVGDVDPSALPKKAVND